MHKSGHIWQTVKTIFLMIVFCSAGLSVISWRMGPTLMRSEEAELERNRDWIVEVVEVPEPRARSVRVTAQVWSGARGSSVREKVLLYIAPDSTLPCQYGDLLLVHSQLTPVEEPQNPDMFNYREYLHKHGISLTGYVAADGMQLLAHRNPNPLKTFAQKAQGRLADIFQQAGMSGREYEIITAILLGADNSLDAELRKSYAAAGVSHILCVSGMHVGIIFMILNYLLNPLELARGTRAVKALLLIVCIWLYACITGLSPSVLRSATMFSFVTIGGLLRRHTNIFHSLTASLFILLAINPMLLFEVGFQLSYLAVFGIVLFQPLLSSIIRAKTKIGQYFLDLLSVSIAAQLGTFPISVFYFGQFPNYFMLSNLSVISLSFVVMVSGIVLLATSFIPFVVKFVAWVLTCEIKTMNGIINTIEQLPYAVTTDIDYHVTQIILLYITILGFYLLILRKRKGWFWVSLCAFALFSADFAVNKIIICQQDEIVVWQIRHVRALSFRTGDKCLFFSDSIQNRKSDLFDYNIGNHYRKQHAEYLFIPLDTNDFQNDFLCKRGRFLNFKGRTLLLLTPDEKILPSNNPLSVDLVVLSRNPRQLPDEVRKAVRFSAVQADGTVTPYYRQRWGLDP